MPGGCRHYHTHGNQRYDDQLAVAKLLCLGFGEQNQVFALGYFLQLPFAAQHQQHIPGMQGGAPYAFVQNFIPAPDGQHRCLVNNPEIDTEQRAPGQAGAGRDKHLVEFHFPRLQVAVFDALFGLSPQCHACRAAPEAYPYCTGS